MGPDQPVAVAFDGSEPSRAALRHAVTVGTALGAELVLLRVVESEHMVEAHEAAEDHPVSAERAQGMVDAQHAEAAAQLRRETERLRDHGVSSVRFEVLEGRAGSAITRRATELDCSLIAIGSRGRPGLIRALLGSVADHVAHHATCPVLLVRADPED